MAVSVSQSLLANASMPLASINAHCCLLAGGVGGRLAPISTPVRPKQFCDLTGQGPMIAVTAERFAGVVPRNKIYVASNEAFEGAVKDSLPWISPENISLEPSGSNKDTGAAIAIFAARLAAIDPDAVGIVVPSDHWIGDVAAFRRNIVQGISTAAQYGAVVTFGVNPSRAENGFGYIGKGEIIDDSGAMFAAGFIQKPEYSATLVNMGSYLWNSGMYVFRAVDFKNMLAKHSPVLLSAAEIYLDILDRGGAGEANEFYKSDMPRTSIDHAVMEPAAFSGEMLVIPLETEWSDIGIWEGIRALYGSGKINPPNAVVKELRKRYPDDYSASKKSFVSRK